MNRADTNALATIARWRTRHIYRYRRPDGPTASGWTGYDQHHPRHRGLSGRLINAAGLPLYLEPTHKPRHSTQEPTHA